MEDRDKAMKVNHLNRIFHNGKTLIVAMDHGNLMRVPGLERPANVIEQVNDYADAYMVNLGTARSFGDMMNGKGIIIRCDGGNTCIEQVNEAECFPTYGAKEARKAGADAMVRMCFPGHSRELDIVRSCAELIREGIDADIPVMLETVPYGLTSNDRWTPDKIEFSVRLAAELGADLAKTVYSGSIDSFRRITEQSFIPVVVLGGGKFASELEFFRMIADAMAGGAAGVAVGRNIWQHPHPRQMTLCLRNIIHHGMKAEEAYRLLQEHVSS